MLSWRKRLDFNSPPHQLKEMECQINDRVPCFVKRISMSSLTSQSISEESLFLRALPWALIITVQEFIMKIWLRSKGKLWILLIKRGLCKLGMASSMVMFSHQAVWVLYKSLCPFIHVSSLKSLQKSPYLALWRLDSMSLWWSCRS